MTTLRVLAVALLLSSEGRAQDVPTPPPPPPPTDAPPLPPLAKRDAATVLAEADAALEDEKLEEASALFAEVVRDFSDTPQAVIAERVLKAIRLATDKRLIVPVGSGKATPAGNQD